MSGEHRVLFVSGSGSGNTLRYRVRYAEEALRAGGARTLAVHFSEPRLADWAADADAVVLYRTPATKRVLGLVAHLRTKTSARISFDVDDRVFLPEHNEHIPFLDALSPARRAAFVDAVESRGKVVPFVDHATGSTSPILDDLRSLTNAPVTVLPNGVSQTAMEIAASVERATDPNRVRIGYFSGSATHDRDWAVAEAAVVQVLRENPSAELWLVGPLAASPALAPVADQVRTLDFVPWRELPKLLASVDINISPLDVTPFTEGKSAIKWLEAALVGTPTLATATRPFLDVVDDGTDAVLVHDPLAWHESLSRLVTEAGVRRSIGESARQAAVRDFGPDVQVARYAAWLADLLAGDRALVDMPALAAERAAQPRVRHLGSRLQPYDFPAALRPMQLEPPKTAAAVDGYRQGLHSVAAVIKRYTGAVRRRLRTVVRLLAR